jgi:hypothetical protein
LAVITDNFDLYCCALLCTLYRAGLGKTAVFVSTTGEQTLIGISHSQSNKLTGSCPQHSVAHRAPAQMPPVGVCSMGDSYTDKKENQIFLIYREIQSGAVAKSYVTNGLLTPQKKVHEFPVSSRDVTNQTPPGQE